MRTELNDVVDIILSQFRESQRLVNEESVVLISPPAHNHQEDEGKYENTTKNSKRQYDGDIHIRHLINLNKNYKFIVVVVTY